MGIVSGPVIIEDGKVFLVKEQGKALLFFPGGKVLNTETPEDTCKREVKEELGIDIEIIRPLKTITIPRPENPNEIVTLVHFLAKRIGEIKPGKNIIEYAWYDLNDLPKDCAPNVFEILKNL